MEHYQAIVNESKIYNLPKSNKEDLFCADREKLINNNRKFFWFLREDGTHLIFLHEENVEKYVFDLFRFFGSQIIPYFWDGKTLLRMSGYNQLIRTLRDNE
jgi:hypothetical protein